MVAPEATTITFPEPVGFSVELKFSSVALELPLTPNPNGLKLALEGEYEPENRQSLTIIFALSVLLKPHQPTIPPIVALLASLLRLPLKVLDFRLIVALKP